MSSDASTVRRDLRRRSWLLRSVQIRQAARRMFDKAHFGTGTVERLLAGLILAALFVIAVLAIGAAAKLGAQWGLTLAGIALVSVLGASAVLILWRRDDAALESERTRVAEEVLVLRERAAELKDAEDEERARREEEAEDRRSRRDRRDAPPRALAPRTRRCPYCREEISRRALKCRHCGEIVDEELASERDRPKSNPGVAAVLSFFVPGLGQMYKRQVASGFLWLWMVASSYLASVVGILFCCGLGIFVLPVAFILHVICLFDAASGA